ncbi:PRD domain-containing protein [Anaeromicrobium sediminis]|uniref:PRD domain-containing protein n=1 Tax=Anaeromicrobium sediminis TaxID=1478221 RepID=UPI00159616C9|nr:PRD domain-containing protein [Anaeromicrobium sediminis]
MRSEKKYKVMKALNNNVILAQELSEKKEMILIGKGIGYGKKESKIVSISDDQVEKRFFKFNSKTKEKYLQLLEELEGEVIGVCEEIISIAESRLGALDQYVHVVLTDHVGFAIERLKNGIEITNPFLYEIKSLYDEEFRIGKIGQKLIKDRMNIEIPDEEAGFIALHIHSAREKKNIKETVKNTRLISEIIEKIKVRLNVELKPDELAYHRLLNHVKASIKRLETNRCIENPLIDTIKKDMKGSFNIAKEIGMHIKKNKNMEVPEGELGYLSIHIERLKRVSKIT